MIVKVCGVRTPEIAEAAIDAGADWIGIVFERRSPRYASDMEARAVRAAAGSRVDVIGVLVEPTLSECDEAAARYRLAGVQVHGALDPQLPALCSVPVIAGINLADAHTAFTEQWWPDVLMLIDAPAGSLPGGTGVPLSLDIAAQMARHRRVILAGGLRPDTVEAAIVRVRPEGVDASTGLERSPGVKDPELVRAFVRSARAADAALVAP
jgi:phosphoribosylanthranilate isomerase